MKTKLGKSNLDLRRYGTDELPEIEVGLRKLLKKPEHKRDLPRDWNGLVEVIVSLRADLRKIIKRKKIRREDVSATLLPPMRNGYSDRWAKMLRKW